MPQDNNQVSLWNISPPPGGAGIWPKMVGHLIGGGQSHYGFFPADYYCPHILLSGRGTVRYGDKEKAINPGDMFCIWPGCNIEYFEDPDHPWVYDWIHLEGTGVRALLEAWGFSDERLVIRPGEPDVVKRLFAQIIKAYREKQPEDAFRIVAWLYEIAALCQPDLPSLVQTGGDAIYLTEQACAMMHALAHTRIGVEDVAQALNVSRSTLFRAFRTSGRGTPLNMLLTLRIQRACELLSNSRQKILTIARSCGFRDDKYFIRAFRQHTGMPPGQYRNLMKDEG